METQSEYTKVIKFSASWCGPCGEYAQTFDKVVSDYDNLDIEYVDIDTDEGVDLSTRYGITGVPTTIVKKGSQFTIKVGVVPESELREWLDE